MDDKKISMQIWDTAGQEKFRSLGKAYYRGSDICIIVFDLTDPTSFNHLSEWMSSFQMSSGPTDEKSIYPFIIVGNKLDLSNERKVSKVEAEKWCKENWNLFYIEASAQNGENIDEIFLEGSKIILKTCEGSPPKKRKDNKLVNAPLIEKDSKSGCCSKN